MRGTPRRASSKESCHGRNCLSCRFLGRLPGSRAQSRDQRPAHLHGHPDCHRPRRRERRGWLAVDLSQRRNRGSRRGGLLFFGPLLMIVFRQKYPRWWFDWNLELQRFINRVLIYCALMDDRYPSTDEHQSVHLDYPYPDVPADLNRWLPLIKWLLALPHYIVLFFLDIAAILVAIAAWFAVLFS